MTSRISSGLGFRYPGVPDFEVETIEQSRAGPIIRTVPIRHEPAFRNTDPLHDSVVRILGAKARPFSVSGRIPFDLSALVLFFRTKTAVSHSLDFPIDADHSTTPALDVLIASCYATDQGGTLVYPPTLPLTITLDLSNHPIMDAIRNTLFPLLPSGHYLTAMRDKLQIIGNGANMTTQIPSVLNDGRVATVYVTLPVRFRGGALVVRDPNGSEERYTGGGGRSADIEWIAFPADCEHEVETVHHGYKLFISYGVYPRTFGPQVDPLITPSPDFLDFFPPILNATRGRKIAFYLSHRYDIDPSEALADSLAPMLKGGDSVLYHTLMHYNLVPELHWTAGGYVWPVDRVVDCSSDGVRGSPGKSHGFPSVRGPYAPTYAVDPYADDAERLRRRIENSGAIPLSELDIILLTDWDLRWPIGKERVAIVAGSEVEKLVVNVLVVTFVP